MPKMMNAVRSAIVMGYKVGKGFTTVVYKIADAFIDCEQFLSADVSILWLIEFYTTL